jgi:hypothetical protein
VYALGLVLYVLLTGRHPIAIETLSSAEFIRMAVTEDAPSASTLATIPGIGRRPLEGDPDNILSKALKKAPAERYASVDAFADDLRRYLTHEPVHARPDSAAYRIGKFVRRHRAGVAVSTSAAVILIGATIVTYLQKVEADRQREEVQAAAVRADSSYRFLSQMVEEIGSEQGALSPTQILDRGMYLLDQQPDANSESMVDKLRQMATFYDDLYDTKKELEVFTRAETLARRLGYTEGLIAVECDLIDTELTLDHRDKAQARLAEAQRQYAGLHRSAPRLRAMIEEEAAAIESANGHNEAAVTHAEHARDLLRADQTSDKLMYPAVLSRLSMYHDALGHAMEAHRYTELAIAAYDGIEGGGTMHRLTLLNNEAADLTNFGEVRAALAISTEVMRRLEARGASRTVGVPFRVNYGGKLAAIGRYPGAVTTLDEAIVDARESKNLYWQQRGQFFRACALVHAGRYTDAKPALNDIETAYRIDAAKNQGSLQAIGVCRAEWRLHTGDAAGAKIVLDGLLKEIKYPANNSSPVLRNALPVAAEIALAQNDLSAAQAYASAGAEYARGVARDPEQSADRGRSLVLLADAQHRSGQDAAAVRTLQQAIPALTGGLGGDHIDVSNAQALLATWSQHPAVGAR